MSFSCNVKPSGVRTRIESQTSLNNYIQIWLYTCSQRARAGRWLPVPLSFSVHLSSVYYLIKTQRTWDRIDCNCVHTNFSDLWGSFFIQKSGPLFVASSGKLLSISSSQSPLSISSSRRRRLAFEKSGASIPNWISMRKRTHETWHDILIANFCLFFLCNYRGSMKPELV